MYNTDKKESYHIAQFGTYDLPSLGDTMFPTIFKLEMEKYFGDRITIDLYSPRGTEHPYNNLPIVHGINELEKNHKEKPYDCLVIGGGEFVHFLPVEYISVDGEKRVYDIGELWDKPQREAKKLNIPVIWNCVGISKDFETLSEIESIQKACQGLKYISVRDAYSKIRLEKMAGVHNVNQVADMLWMFNRHFTEEDLRKYREKLSEENEFLKKDYLVLQYGTSLDYKKIAKIVNRIAKDYGLEVILLTINYCHQDQEIIEKIVKEFPEFKIIDRLLQPKEIMSVIAGAKYFLGTSLHGNVTAMSYGVKNLCLDMYPSFVSKMDGLFDMLEKSKCVINGANTLRHSFEKLVQIDEREQTLKKIEQIQKKLDQHFFEISRVIAKKSFQKYEVEKVEEKKFFVKGIMDNGVVSSKCIQLFQSEEITLSFELENVNGEYEGILYQPQSFIIERMDILENGTKIKYEYENLIENERKISLFQDHCKFKAFSARNQVGKNRIIEIKIKMKFGEEIERYYLKIEKKRLEQEKYQLEVKYKQSQGHVEKLLESERVLQEAQRKSFEKEQQLGQEILNKQGHIEQLLQIERDLNNQLGALKSSRTWRITMGLQRISLFIAPESSIRRLFLKMLFKLLRHPVRSIKMLSPRKIRHFFFYLREEGPGFVSKRMDESMQGIAIQPLNLECIALDAEKPFEQYTELKFVKQENPIVSIVIPVYNQFAYTFNCLQSILNNSGTDISYEIIIANDCSTDDTTRLQEKVDNILIVTNENNLRFLKNCNHAAKYAKGKYILFLNNDTQVQKDWLNPLVQLIESNEKIGMVGSKLIYADGSLQEAGGIIWKDASAWNYGNRSDPSAPEFNYVKETDYISGAAIMIRSSLWKEIGGFDERFAPAYYEDTDLACEVRSRGFKVMYQPLSIVVHFEGISNGTDVSSGQKSYQMENQKKFYEKWKNELNRDNFPNGEKVFLAKDRSGNKKTLLMVDHYVPMYDKDAGSRCMFYYLNLFVNMGYNVKFIGDNFYKHEPYTTALQQMGIEVLYGNYYFNNWKDWLKSNGKYFDYVFLSRPHISIKYIDFVREYTNAKIIYFGHDLHYLREMREYQLNGNEQSLKDSKEWKKTELELMRKADVSYYLSKVELEEIAKVDSSVKVRRVPINIYTDIPDIHYKAEDREDIIFVGGFGHPPNVDAVSWLGEEIMPKVWEKMPNITLHVIGSNPPNEIKNLACEHLIIHGFVSDEDLEELYQGIKLAIVPLRFGAGIKGKIIEAMMRGIPMVTTSIGIEGIEGAEQIVKVSDETVGLADFIVNLYANTMKLEEMAEKEHRYIVDNYSEEEAVRVLKADFEFD